MPFQNNMASGDDLECCIKAHIKAAAGGKEGTIVNNKCLKKVATDSKLSKIIPQNELDIAFMKVMSKCDGKKQG